MKISEVLLSEDAHEHLRNIPTSSVRVLARTLFGDVLGSVFRRVEFGQALYNLTLGNGSHVEIYIFGEPGHLKVKRA